MPETLSIRRQIGQRLLAGFYGLQMDEEFINLVKEYKVSNVILFAWNIRDRQQMMRLCADIQALVREQTGHSALIAIDQEGGIVSRLPADCTRVPGAMALASTGDERYVYEAGRITGSELRALGANFNFAPVLDINSNPDNPVIGVRSYGDTPQTVIRCSAEAIRAYAQEGILSCGKHFPGHGDTNVDSHLALPTVDKSLSQLWANELLPFQAAVRAGIPAIMTSHILFPQLDAQYPATLSHTILTGLLRESLGFDGLIVTDCMEMKAIQNTFGTCQGALRAMQAGADIICISHTAAHVREIAQQAERMLETGEMDAAQMRRSVERILQAKRMLDAAPNGDASQIGSATHTRANLSLLKKTIVPVRLPQGQLPPLGERPFFAGCADYRASLVSNKADETFTFPAYMAAKLGGQGIVTPLNPSGEDIAQAVRRAAQATTIVLGTYNGHLNPGQLALADAFAQTGIPTIVVALRNPYDLSRLDARIHALAAFEYTRQCFNVLARILAGNLQPSGRLSVKL